MRFSTLAAALIASASAGVYGQAIDTAYITAVITALKYVGDARLDATKY
jgi:hypothetical protein